MKEGGNAMQRKYFGFIVAGFLALIIVMMLSVNTMAAYQNQGGDSVEMPFKTDMTDRTMLKEILVNQKKTLGLLQEIKASIKGKK